MPLWLVMSMLATIHPLVKSNFSFIGGNFNKPSVKSKISVSQ
jgi:hypothetical protein